MRRLPHRAAFFFDRLVFGTLGFGGVFTRTRNTSSNSITPRFLRLFDSARALDCGNLCRSAMVKLFDLRRLLAGDFDYLVVGSVEPYVANSIGAIYTREVRLSRDNLIHICERKQHASIEELVMLPTAILNGFAIYDAKRQRCTTISWQSPDPATRFMVALKSNNYGTEIYVTTFHRMREGQTKSLLRRGHPLRTHK
jgi:hypothetical protein